MFDLGYLANDIFVVVVVVGLFIDLWIFVVAGCFGHVFRFILLVLWFYKFETQISQLVSWVSVLHVLPL
jgi:hypothetical protein